jgi:hypothetical protein
MPEPISIALTQLALWYDPTRIQTWPSFLASLPEGVTAKSPTDLGRSFATKRMTSNRHSAAYNLVRNLTGLEIRGAQLQLRGVGFLEYSPDGYRVSSRGRKLGNTYSKNPDGTDWLHQLVDALLGREPRTRAFVKLLSGQGAALVFDGGSWFEGPYRRARLERTGEPDTFPLDASDEHPTLREPLTEDAWWCLGDWRTDPILEGTASCNFRGIRDDRFSLHDIGLALRAACEALNMAKVLGTTGGTIQLDTTAVIDLFPHRAAEFGWIREEITDSDLISILAEVLPNLRIPTGHVIASELRSELQTKGIRDPDRAIAAAESEGRLLIYAEDYGQSRHGMGLFGDPRKQLVKLRIVGGVGDHI